MYILESRELTKLCRFRSDYFIIEGVSLHLAAPGRNLIFLFSFLTSGAIMAKDSEIDTKEEVSTDRADL